jgi:PKD repeat protein
LAFITPLIGTLLPNPLPLTASSIFPIRVGVVSGGGSIPPVGPMAGFVADTTSCTAPCTVNFNDQSTGAPISWTWDFDDDGTADNTVDRDPTVTYPDPGLYSVTLTIANTNGSDSMTRVGYIDVQPVQPDVPVADYSGSPLSGPAPLSVQFTDLSTSSSGPITGWQWDFQNDGTVDDTAQNPSFMFSTAGSYTVSLIATNAVGDSTPKVVANYIVTTTPMCNVPNFMDQGGTPSGAVSGEWQAAGFQAMVIFTPILPWSNPGKVRDQTPEPAVSAPCTTQVLTVAPTNNSLP